MKQFLLILFCVISGNYLYAQDADCKVLLDSLKGTYTGECKNGKANGTGKAVGINTYDGEFKNGLPEGKGKYTWSNGDYYFGSWKKGQKDGKGELHHFEKKSPFLYCQAAVTKPLNLKVSYQIFDDDHLVYWPPSGNHCE